VKLRCFEETSLAVLDASIRDNLEKYRNKSSWVEEFFGKKPYALDAHASTEGEVVLQTPEAGENYDLENTKRLYGALRGLGRAKAADERLWAYLAHVTYWNYMRKRWPIDGSSAQQSGEDPVAFVRERYFLPGDDGRELTKNGIARLWWYGEFSYCEELSDPYELTALLLYDLDIAEIILKPNFSRNKDILKGVLLALGEFKAINNRMPDKTIVKAAMDHLNLRGSLVILDALGSDRIKREVLDSFGRSLAKPKAP